MDMIPLGVYPSKLEIRGGGHLEHITTTYSFRELGHANLEIERGSSYGGYSSVFEFGPKEHVTQVKTFNEPYVERMDVTTNMKSTGWRPDNGHGSWEAIFNIAATDRFLGWQGLEGAVLDSLDPLVVVFSPAEWSKPTLQRHRPVYAPLKLIKQVRKITPVPGPHIPNDDDIIGAIALWARAKSREIHDAYMEKGGWEGWAQVEIAAQFRRFFNKSSIFREIQVYKDGFRLVDLLVEHHDGKGNVIARDIIELKCESLFQDAKDGESDLFMRMQADHKKVNSPLWDQYRSARRWTIGISCLMRAAMEGAHFSEFESRCAVQSTITKDGIYVWYAVSGPKLLDTGYE